jgi:acyl-CoA synthetase (AMP-forming)/AMP-acid ligase II
VHSPGNQMNPFHALLDAVVEHRTDEEALVGARDRLTYGELRTAIDLQASEYESVFAHQPPTVLLVTENGVAAATWLLTLLVAGCYVALVDASIDGRQLSRLLEMMRPSRFVIVGREAVDDLVAQLVDAGARRPVATRVGNAILLEVAWPSPLGIDFPLRGPGTLFLTSGTSGVPKGVCHDASSLVHALWSTDSLQRPNAGSVALTDAAIIQQLVSRMTTQPRLGLTFLSGMPVTTIAGFTMLTSMLLMGERAVIAPNFEPDAYVHLVRQLDVSTLGLSPFMALRLLRIVKRSSEAKMPSLRVIGLGGGPVPEGLARELEARLECIVYASYGMTETGGPVISGRWFDDSDVRHNATGWPVGGAEVKIGTVDGMPIAPGLRGELFVRTNALARHYLIGGGLVSMPIVSGWFRTGDRALVRTDGAIHVVGRTSDAILRGGRTIDPVEIEHALEGIDGVERALVFGRPSRVPGEEDICAVLVTEAELSREVVVAECRRMLPSGQMPQRFRRARALPLTRDEAVISGSAEQVWNEAMELPYHVDL